MWPKYLLKLMQIKLSDLQFLHIFHCQTCYSYEFVDIQLVNQLLRSCKWRKSVNFVKIKGPKEVQPLGIKAKKFYIYQLKTS